MLRCAKLSMSRFTVCRCSLMSLKCWVASYTPAAGPGCAMPLTSLTVSLMEFLRQKVALDSRITSRMSQMSKGKITFLRSMQQIIKKKTKKKTGILKNCPQNWKITSKNYIIMPSSFTKGCLSTENTK